MILWMYVGMPNYFNVDNQDVILVPQGIEPKGDQFKNIYQSGCIAWKV